MKVLFLAYDLGTAGGVGTFNYELSVELSRLGIDVFVITQSKSLNEVKINSDSNMKFYGLPSLKIPPKDVVFHFLNAKNITDIVRTEKFDLIHDSSGCIGLIPWISRLAPVIVTVHGSPLLGLLRLTYGSIEDKLRHILFKMSHRLPSKTLSLLAKPYVDKFVFVSKSSFRILLLKPLLNLRLKMNVFISRSLIKYLFSPPINT